MADGEWVMSADGEQFLTSLGLWDICESCCASGPFFGGSFVDLCDVNGAVGVAYNSNPVTYWKGGATQTLGTYTASESNLIGIGTLDGSTTYAGYPYVLASTLEYIPSNPFATRWRLRIYFIRATDVNGTSAWSTPAVVYTESASSRIFNCGGTVLVDDKYPAMMTGSGFLRSSDVDGTSWNTPVALTSYPNTMRRIALVDNRPAVLGSSSSTVYYIRASDVNGDTWPSSLKSFSGTNTQAVGLCDHKGVPAIVYRDSYGPWYATNIRVPTYRAGTDADGSGWTTPVRVYSSNDGLENNIASDGTNLAIWHQAGGTINGGGTILVSTSSNDGGTWSVAESVTSTNESAFSTPIMGLSEGTYIGGDYNFAWIIGGANPTVAIRGKLMLNTDDL